MITPERLSAWRIFPRLLITLYGIAFWRTTEWFMQLPDPTNAQSAFVSVIVGAGAAWFGLYVGGTRLTKAKSEEKEQMDSVRLVERIFKIIRARQAQINEIITSNQVKDWNDYQNHLGQLETLNYIEQELSDLLKKQEQDEHSNFTETRR